MENKTGLNKVGDVERWLVPARNSSRPWVAFLYASCLPTWRTKTSGGISRSTIHYATKNPMRTRVPVMLSPFLYCGSVEAKVSRKIMCFTRAIRLFLQLLIQILYLRTDHATNLLLQQGTTTNAILE